MQATITPDNFNYEPYRIYENDPKFLRLTKVRDFLIELTKRDERKFDYATFMGIFTKNMLPMDTPPTRDAMTSQVRHVAYCQDDTSIVEHSTKTAIYDSDNCGTCACIAGWTEILNRIPIQNLNVAFGCSTEIIARRVLQLDSDDARFLFFGAKGYGLHDLGIGADSDEENFGIKDAIERLNILINKEERESSAPE